VNPSDRPKPVERPEGIDLTAEEGFVLARIDGRLTMRDIADLTGIGEEKVDAIVSELAAKGVISVPMGGGVEYFASDDLGLPELEIVDEMPEIESHDQDDFKAALAFARDGSEPPPQDLSYERAAQEREEEAAAATDETLLEELPFLEEVVDEEGIEAPPQSTPEPDEPAADEAEAKAFAEPHTFRRLYEEKYRGLEAGVRAKAAMTASAMELYAFCFDPDPKVIQAMLQNSHVGFAHGRFIAGWHSTSAGLEHLATRPEFIRDAGIQRRLMRNTHLSESLLKRIVQPKRLVEIFRAAIDKDIPQLSRTRVRGVLRHKFTGMAQPEERTELIVQTEGRVLPLLVGCTFDGRTTQMLCSRQYNSMIFVQNLAKFPATPPTLLTHLIKQPSVKRNQAIKRMLLQHKNMPSDAKKYA
jgi:hypothetical protein